ncbi:unnamed protein product [Adineta ricciae]|uniref:Fork-head domain-containing protein n=1 Tax=Adineta ricciae TaxID=249248 RepID=A0A813MJZ7_ADIRI|nr:unnamed protein product [Adineta ricciae]CAF1366489.1 unnamed protein product [Adineta ricciae]
MSNEEDECDSSSLFPMASQSDVASFLRSQTVKLTGLSATATDDDDDDDDENSINDHLFASLTQHRSTVPKTCLSHSCFASISSQAANTIDDLTELKWLSTFKFKENKQQTSGLNNSTHDSISKLSNDLKTRVHNDSASYGALTFLAMHSQRNDQQSPWSLSIKQIYEYIQRNHPKVLNKRGWKNALKQTLNTIPCFIKTKHETAKSNSMWTIDPYYRPLLTKAYLSNVALQDNKSVSLRSESNQTSEMVVHHFPPKATVKTKALPRLYEQLCGKETQIKALSNSNADHGYAITGDKRALSMSSSTSLRTLRNNDNNRYSSTSPRPSKRNKHNKSPHPQGDDSVTLNEKSTVVTPCPNDDHMYLEKQIILTKKPNEQSVDEDDECDSSSLTHSSGAQTSIHNRKSLLPRKRTSVDFVLRRAKTRMSRRIIEQDLELLRQPNANTSVE